MEECHSCSKYSVEPHCLFIKGDTGVGKTTLIRKYISRYPRRNSRDGTQIPVFNSSLPAIATIKGVASKLISDLGDPLALRGTTVQQTERFIRLLKSCKVELLIFDEFQHLVESGSRKTLSNVADWLKAVINETGIPMILFGMPCSDDLLCQNRQLKRRFMAVEKLSSFNWGNSADSQKDYRLFLATIDKQLPFPERSCLAERDIAHRFFCATRGNVGATMSIVRWSARFALKEKAMSCKEYLSRGFERQYGIKIERSRNPFSCDQATLEPASSLLFGQGFSLGQILSAS